MRWLEFLCILKGGGGSKKLSVFKRGGTSRKFQMCSTNSTFLCGSGGFSLHSLLGATYMWTDCSGYNVEV